MDFDLTALDTHITRVRLTGRLDTPGVDRIETRFAAALIPAGRPVIVDLGGVTMLTSMGLRMLISTARALSLKGAPFILYGANEFVQDVLDNAAIEQIIPVVASEAQAVAGARL